MVMGNKYFDVCVVPFLNPQLLYHVADTRLTTHRGGIVLNWSEFGTFSTAWVRQNHQLAVTLKEESENRAKIGHEVSNTINVVLPFWQVKLRGSIWLC